MASPVDSGMLKDSTKTKGNMPRSGSGSGSMPTKKITRVAVPRGGAEKVTAPAARLQARVTKQEKKGGMSVKTALAKATERWEQLADARKKFETEPAAKKTGGRFELSSTPMESLKSAKERRYRECLKEIETACAEQGISLSLKGLPGPSEIRIAIAGKQQGTRPSPAKHSSMVAASKSAVAPATYGGGERSAATKRKRTDLDDDIACAKRAKLGVLAEEEVGGTEKVVVPKGVKRKSEAVDAEDESGAKKARTEPARVDPGKSTSKAAKKPSPRKTEHQKMAPKSASQSKKLGDEAAGSDSVMGEVKGEGKTADEVKVKKIGDGKRSGEENVKTETKDDGTKPTGAYRHDSECFSIAVIQLLVAALDGKDLDEVLGPVNGNVALDVDTDTACQLNKGMKLSARSMDDVPRTVRKAVKALGDHAKIGLKNKLRQILHDLRDDQTSKAVSLYSFQTLFAVGSVDDQERSHLDGRTQQDSFEFFQKLMNVLCDGDDATASDALKSLFEVSTTTSCICNAGNVKDATPQPKAMYHTVIVPADKAADGQAHDLQRLINDSMQNETERVCSECTEPLVEVIKVTSESEYVILHLSRAKFADNVSFKAQTEVAMLPAAGVSFGDSQYDLAAAVMHRGNTPNLGHYTTYRKHAGEWWLLNDNKVTKKLPTDSEESKSTMLLLKKRQS
ncbi:ATP-dependent DNA helicase srs2 [Elasticomyces elasticus]|uniref:ATP-dependent DNA helicase srs2 n=1 Tax=Elasticomyces elasticus TaxID=574655 RepID=A0AAN8A335_9PEZI|nr:ATP-dependent DNA helicase srs2 [Elasticomyces elasticus]